MGNEKRVEERKDEGEKRRKEKKGRGAAKEDYGTGAGKHFFKVFFPKKSGENLMIPPPFYQYLEEEPNRWISLKGPSGNSWQVMLTSGSKGLAFMQGWKEFVMDHFLNWGHFLVFTYDGCSEFSVIVLCPSGIDDKSALDAQPSKEIVVKEEVGQWVLDTKAAATSKKELPAVPSVEGNRKIRKRVRQLNDVKVNGPALKRNISAQTKHEERKPEAIGSTSKAAPTFVLNSKKDLQYVLDESSSGNKTQIRPKDVPRSVMSKKFRLPVVISQRRPITQAEKDRALKRAKEFKSKNPLALQVMTSCHVYAGFFMNIPCEFVKESLPQTSMKMTLWDPQGKSWDVYYQYYNCRCVAAAFTGGWGKFAIGNNLEKFDVCIFELFKEDNIKVHIYRVVPEITLLIRNSS
ncbi:hypothetical protein EJB05_27888, partial [Eragrostis curvula]